MLLLTALLPVRGVTSRLDVADSAAPRRCCPSSHSRWHRHTHVVRWRRRRARAPRARAAPKPGGASLVLLPAGAVPTLALAPAGRPMRQVRPHPVVVQRMRWLVRLALLLARLHLDPPEPPAPRHLPPSHTAAGCRRRRRRRRRRQPTPPSRRRHPHAATLTPPRTDATSRRCARCE